MTDILRITSAAVDSLLSASSCSGRSGRSSVRMKAHQLKELTTEEVLRRSSSAPSDLPDLSLSLLSSRANSSAAEAPCFTEHRTPVGCGVSGRVDESVHLVAPSTGSSENLTIIDVGTPRSLEDTVDMIPTRDGQESFQTSSNVSRDSKRTDVSNTTSNLSSQVSSLKSDQVVGSSTPTHGVSQTEPPALPSTCRTGLQQGVLVKPTTSPPPPDDKVTVQRHPSSQSARNALREGVTAPGGPVLVQRAAPPPPPPQQSYDQTAQIAAAVAAAVAATAPFQQLRSDVEEQLARIAAQIQESVGGALQSREQQPEKGEQVSEEKEQQKEQLQLAHVTDPSLDLTLLPEISTPLHPRSVPVPASCRMKGGDVRQHFIEREVQREEDEELRAMKEQLKDVLEDARKARREVEELKRAERLSAVSSSRPTDSAAEVYLDEIRKRERDVPRAERRDYRIPAYLLEGKLLLREAEEKKREVDQGRCPLDTTFRCQDHVDGEGEEVARKVAAAMERVTRELEEERAMKKKKPGKKPPEKKIVKKVKKKKTSTEMSLADKKALYEKVRQENEYQRVKANISYLKLQEQDLLTQRPAAPEPIERSYRRDGLPQSYPISCRVAPESTSTPLQKSITPGHPASQFDVTLPAQRDAAVGVSRAGGVDVGIGRSRLSESAVGVSRLGGVDVGIGRSRLSESAVSQREVAVGTSLTTPLQRLVQGYPGKDDTVSSESIPSEDSFLHVMTVKGERRPAPPSAQTVQWRAATPPAVRDRREARERAIGAVESAILEKLLQPEDREVDAELRAVLGEDVHQQALAAGLTPDQVHTLLSDVIAEQMEGRIAEKLQPVAEKESKVEEGGEDYAAESFEQVSDSSRTTSSLSIVVTPSNSTENSARTPASVSTRFPGDSPILSPDTPSLTPEPLSTPPPDDRLVSAARNQVVRPRMATLEDTLEQIPLDITEEQELSYRDALTPALTSLHGLTSSPQPTQVGIQTPNDTALSLISQHPLDQDEEDEEDQEERESDKSAVDLRTTSHTVSEHPSDSLLTSPTVTDNPISAGEILSGGVPSELSMLGGPLSEGEWPLSPGNVQMLQLIRNPEIRQLYEMRANAPNSPNHQQLESVTPSPKHPSPAGKVEEQARKPPPSGRRPSLQTPSPLPKTQSAENFETLELVTPLPDASPSPPPFLGLTLDDYSYSEGGVTGSESF